MQTPETLSLSSDLGVNVAHESLISEVMPQSADSR